MSEISKLEPMALWSHFEQILQVPRPSKHEGKIIEFLIGFAKRHKLDYKTDSVGNVLILKPATEGMESHPGVVLQSHMDMVCEKNSNVTFDFNKDAIRTEITPDGWVKAIGTTLGADCGIGMAAAMAVLTATDIAHPAIEALFTVDEETGLTGAFALSKEMLSGKYLINLDSEDEGEIFIGCAGGIDTLATFTFDGENSPKNYAFFRVDVSGLSGGHSGDDIDKGRANSNKLLTRILWLGAHNAELRLSYFDGGNLRNAIPREAYAIFGVPVKQTQAMKNIFEKCKADAEIEFAHTEPNIKLAMSEMPDVSTVIDQESQWGLLNALQGVANGVLAMSAAMPGMVETSTNLASVKFKGKDKIVVTSSQRSSLEGAKSDAAATIESIYTLAGAEVVHSDGYPGWNPDPSSHLLAVTRECYVDLFGVEPKVRAIHAGLECGLFLEKYPRLEMVSFGPTLRGVHSPDERLEISTVDKFWKLLVETLKRL